MNSAEHDYAPAFTREAALGLIAAPDLPMLRNGRLTIAKADGQHGAGVFSQPALGFLQRKRRLQDAILQLGKEMHHGSSDAARDRQHRSISRTRWTGMGIAASVRRGSAGS